MNLLCKGMAKKRIAQYLKMSVLVSYVGNSIKVCISACLQISIRWEHLHTQNMLLVFITRVKIPISNYSLMSIFIFRVGIITTNVYI